MSDDLHALEAWAGALLAKLQPAQRRAINHKVAIDLRRSQAQRIKAQQGPDGAAYPARKRRKELKGKNGRIKRQKATMFNKIRTARYLKVSANPEKITLGFFNRIARIAQIHQYGLQDHITKSGKPYKYTQRKLLGLSQTDQSLIRESLISYIKLL